MLRGALFPLLRLFTPITVRNAENLRGLTGPVIVAANHVSHLDTPMLLTVLPASIRRRLAVAAATDYFYRFRIVGAVVSLLFGTVPFDRRGNSGESLARWQALVSEGHCVLIFPEGTRSHDGKLGRIRSGVAVLATTTDTPVLPVYVHGLADLVPRGRRPRLRGGLVVDVGDQLTPAADEAVGDFRDRVAEALEALARRRSS